MGIFYVLYSSPAIIMSSAWPSLPATTSKYAYNVVQAILFMLKIIGQSNVTAPLSADEDGVTRKHSGH